MKQVLRVGIGGPVGSGKTALLRCLCAELKDRFNIAVVTNDIYTKEDAQFLLRHKALEEDRIMEQQHLEAEQNRKIKKELIKRRSTPQQVNYRHCVFHLIRTFWKS